MSFSNKDLERLKEIISIYVHAQINESIFDHEFLQNLLTRLEAAENSALDVPALCKTFDYCEEMGSYSQTSYDALARYEAWLKSKADGQ